jgi:CarD family transcriptional regulator
MLLYAGKKVVYPNRGPCRIGPLVKKNIGGHPGTFYPLVIIDAGGDVVFVPVDRVESLGIRQLIRKTEVPRLLRRLHERDEVANGPTSRMSWKQRATDNLHLFASGSALDLATIVRTLTHLNHLKPLAPRDRDVLDRARKYLICEISEVMGKSRTAAEQLVNDALKAAERKPLKLLTIGIPRASIDASGPHR